MKMGGMLSCLACCYVQTRFHASFARCSQASFSFMAESSLLAQAPGAAEPFSFSMPATFMNSLSRYWSESGTEIICFIPRQGDLFCVAVNMIDLQQFHLRKHFLQKAQWLIVRLQELHRKDVSASESTDSTAIPARNRPLSLEGVSHWRATGTVCVRSISKDLACSTERSCLLSEICRVRSDV